MPRNKFQKIIFGVIMSYAMAFGMELYNTAINMGIALQPGGLSHMTWTAVGTGMKEMLIMGIFVLIVSELFGNRMGQRFMQKHTTESDSPYFHQLMRQAGTVAVMCPAMSMLASVLFFIIGQGLPLTQLPVIWIGTVFKNFPMAFFWNMFAAAPFTHWLFENLFPEKEHDSESLMGKAELAN